jgi:hypothetical protein
MESKPHYGRIKNWCFVAGGNNGRNLFVIGDALDHPSIREGISTSTVVRFDAETGEIETRNSRYRLVDEGEPSPREGWPNPGDKMRFLNQNGYDYQRENARKAGFIEGEVYVVQSCDVGDFNHTIIFSGHPGEHNGVMFENIAPIAL